MVDLLIQAVAEVKLPGGRFDVRMIRSARFLALARDGDTLTITATVGRAQLNAPLLADARFVRSDGVLASRIKAELRVVDA